MKMEFKTGACPLITLLANAIKTIRQMWARHVAAWVAPSIRRNLFKLLEEIYAFTAIRWSCTSLRGGCAMLSYSDARLFFQQKMVDTSCSLPLMKWFEFRHFMRAKMWQLRTIWYRKGKTRDNTLGVARFVAVVVAVSLINSSSWPRRSICSTKRWIMSWTPSFRPCSTIFRSLVTQSKAKILSKPWNFCKKEALARTYSSRYSTATHTCRHQWFATSIRLVLLTWCRA